MDPSRDDRKRKRKPNEMEEELSQSEEQQSQSEAEEEVIIDDDEEEKHESDEEPGDNLEDFAERDNRADPRLDHYESEGIDDEISEKSFDPEARREADREVDERNKARMLKSKRLPAAFQHELFDEMHSEDDEIRREMKKQRERNLVLEQGIEIEGDEPEDEKYLDMEEARGKLHLWIKEPRTVRWIRRKFQHFLRTFRNEEGEAVYDHQLREMCDNNKQSIEIHYKHLSSSLPTMSYWVAYEPATILPYLNAVALELALQFYPTYDQIHSEIYVKIKNLPVMDNIRDLRQNYLNTLIQTKGVITKRSAVFSQLKMIYYICNKCRDRKGPIYQHNNAEIKLGACAVCQSNGPFSVDTENTIYRNYQKITLQESPGEVEPGRVPRHKEVILLGDNIDVARPGDEVILTGIYTNRYDYSLNIKHGFPIFSTLIEAVYICRMAEEKTAEITDEEKKKIRKIARDQQAGKLIIKSLAPSIYGHHHVKTALALSMFGGEAKDIGGKHRIRGDINTLILGDPGTAKSQFLKYVEKTFNRCIYTTGKGASAVGLTASVHRDPSTREWTLEGGALVLADKGICLIDEFDKMGDQDRTSIHEAMEQQSISISKAGIVTSLQARCAVIAAANPVKGRYDSQLSFADNVHLGDPILSRFDILCVVRDEVDIDADGALASFVINSHMKNHPFVKKLEGDEEALGKIKANLLPEVSYGEKDLIDQDLLKKYIIYARKNIRPKISGIDKEKITRFYSELRQESSVSGGINIAVRHIESIIRMAEANARMHLREIVRDDDIDMAISVMLESFIQSQKYSIAKLVRRKFSNYLTFRQDNNTILTHLLNKLIREQYHLMQHMMGDDKTIKEVKVPIEQLELEAKALQIHDITTFLSSESFTRSYIIRGKLIVRVL